MVSFANTSTPATRVEQLVQNEATSLLADPNSATPWTNLIQRELGPSFVSQWGGTSPAAAATTPVASLFPQLAATQPVSNLDIGNFLQSLGVSPQFAPQFAPQLAGLLAPAAEVGRSEFGKPPAEWSGWADMSDEEVRQLKEQGGTLGQGMSDMQKLALGLTGNLGMGFLNKMSSFGASGEELRREKKAEEEAKIAARLSAGLTAQPTLGEKFGNLFGGWGTSDGNGGGSVHSGSNDFNPFDDPRGADS